MKILPTIILVAAIFLFSACSSDARDKYFVCKGMSGVGRYQQASLFPESLTLHVNGQRLTIDASQAFSATYEVCDESDTVVFFTSLGGKTFCSTGPADLTGIVKNGSFNKVSGQLEVAATGELNGDYQCKEASKKLEH